MSVIWYKVWSDLWGNKVRTVLAILSIAVGVFAIGATFGMSDQLLAGMDAAHRASIPAHFTISVTRNIDKDIANRLEKTEGVEQIALGNFSSIRYKIRPEDEWDAAWLIMREDYEEQEYELLELKAGEWPHRSRIGVERLSSQFFDLDIEDTVYFEVDDRPKERKINGILRHNFVPPPEFGGNAVFFTDAEGMELFDISQGEYNQILVRVSPYSEALARDAASEIKDRLSKEDIGVAVTIYQDPEEHWGRFIIEGINLVLEIMAIVSLGASVILIINTLTAVITQQTNQIGIIKAIGGTQDKIIQIYLAMVLAYGLLSLLIALPLGAMLAFGTTQYLLNLFNIEYEQFQYSIRAFGLQAVAALLVPLIAALWPILSGATITVREAISSYGLGGDFGGSWIDRTVEKLARQFLSAPYAVALGNMFRRKGRLLLTQTVLVLAGTMFLVVMSLSSSIDRTLDNIYAQNDYDFVMVFDDTERVDYTGSLAENIEGIEYAEVWFSYGASILKGGQRLKEAGIGAQLTGIPNGSDIFRPSLMVAGRWLDPNDGPAIVMRKETAEDNGIKVGDTVTLDLGDLGDDEWQVVGFYEDIFGGDIGSTDPIYANLDAVFKATKQYNEGDQVRVRTLFHDKNYVEAVMTQLRELYEQKNIEVVEALTLIQDRSNADSQFSITITMLLVLAVIMALVGGIGLMGALSISVVERTREIGVMRAVGARTFTILGMFMMEGVLQGLLSWLVAVPVSFVLGKPMANTLGRIMFDASLDYQYNLEAIFIWLVIMLVISTLASILPAHGATTISVRESLAYQ